MPRVLTSTLILLTLTVLLFGARPLRAEEIEPGGGNGEPIMPAGQRIQELAKRLQVRIDTTDFRGPRKLKDALNWLSDKLEATGKNDVPLVANSDALCPRGQGDGDLWDTKVSLPSVPRKLSAATVLRLIMWQLPNKDAIYVIQPMWYVEITTAADAERVLAWQLKRQVAVKFEGVPLAKALQELADQYRFRLDLRPEVTGKLQTPVTATFESTSLRKALETLTGNVGLAFVTTEGTVHVTTSVRAQFLRMRQRSSSQEK